jgi:DNA-binding response OmpR family regulator
LIPPKYPKVLVVDDERDVLITIKKGLEEYGFLVDAFSDPIEALASFRASDYGISLLDLRLPCMNGLELSLKIRKLDKAVKVCFITSFPAYYETLVEENPDLDFPCFIKKPVTIDALVKRIKSELHVVD